MSVVEKVDQKVEENTKERKLFVYKPDERYPCSPWQSAVGFTPLMIDVLNNVFNEENLKYINDKNSEGWTALHIAVRNTYSEHSKPEKFVKYDNYNFETTNEMVRYLIKNGADVNVRDIEGLCPLYRGMFRSVYPGCIETVRILLDNCANIKLMDKYGRNIFYYIKLMKGEDWTEMHNFLMDYFTENFSKSFIEKLKMQNQTSNPGLTSPQPANKLNNHLGDFKKLDLEIEYLNTEISKMQEILKLREKAKELKKLLV